MKDHYKNKELSHVQYWDVNICILERRRKNFHKIILSGSKILLYLMKIS